MYCVRKVTNDLYWVGANDHRLALFENCFPIPRGVSYNAYCLLDEKTVLFDTVGKSVQAIAKMAGITVPEGARVLVSEQTEVGPKNPYSREKLCPILAFFVEDTWEKCCEKSIAILQNEGAGHTMTIHTSNQEIVRQFALKKPVSRLLVNTPGALGGVGATTNLAPALTLGCGAVGGSATSDNVNPMNLINIRRVAWGVRELEDLRKLSPVPAANTGTSCCGTTSCTSNLNSADVERITREILAAVLAKK